MRFKPYSASKLGLYQQCPKKFHYMYVVYKGRFINNKAFEKGKLVHSVIENVLKGTLERFRVPRNYEFLEVPDINEALRATLVFCKTPRFQDLKYPTGGRFFTERYFSLDKDLVPCDRSRSILNGVVDYAQVQEAFRRGIVVDWKTGGKSLSSLVRFPKDEEQLEIYAIWALQEFGLEAVDAKFAFVEHDHFQEVVYEEGELRRLKSKILGMIATVEEDDRFERITGPLCSYCDFEKECLNL
jgi:CRISPR/Cas system-associated exonuclease Cas4 (RecB family)